MLEELKNSLWQQFGASMDMLVNTIAACPLAMYQTNKRFFYTAYHTAVFLDYYLTVPPTDFVAQLPFTLREKEDMPADALDDVLPNEHYTKEQLLGYMAASKEKGHALIMGIKETDNPRFVEQHEADGMVYSLLEILLYNMRHVQHHTAQLNKMLRENGHEPTKWVARTS